MTSNTELQTAATPASDDQVQVLLVEDDDGDALLVSELLSEVGAAVVVRRARSLTQAKGLVPGAACVLLDGQVPYVPGVRAVVPQRCLLGRRGEQAVPGHANTVSDTTDIPGEVKRRFLPGLKPRVSAPRS